MFFKKYHDKKLNFLIYLRNWMLNVDLLKIHPPQKRKDEGKTGIQFPTKENQE
jgi:hypothetical protein